MPRARELGIEIGTLPPGPNNAITDVAGVKVGYKTLIEGDSVRTGVTVITAFDGSESLFAGFHRLNGTGEMTGLHYVRESGMLQSPIAITNTFSVGAVHEGIVAYSARHGRGARWFAEWALPVVAETFDGFLNDITGFHVRPAHVDAALADMRSGPIAEGNVGGGTGMICHGFKGGTGTASRLVTIEAVSPATTESGGSAAEPASAPFTVGVLVQANHGQRTRLRVNGVPVGERVPASEVPLPHREPERGSIIVVVATDAPLIPTQCDALAQRAALGIGRTGGLGEHSSGDLIFAFATGNRDLTSLTLGGTAPPLTMPLRMLTNVYLNGLFAAVVEATEEAIVNALLAADTMAGAGGALAYGLEPQRLLEALGDMNQS